MSTVRNLVFGLLSFAFFLLVLGNVSLSHLSGDSLPDKSYLEGKTYQELPEISVSSVGSGTFQDESEAYLSDHFPHRDGVVIYNAAIQRKCIELGNTVFGFKVYPTFFGSSTLYAPQYGLVVDAPKSKNSYNSDEVESAIESWSQFISTHDDARWCFAMVDRTTTTEASPAYGLIADPAGYSYFHSMMQESFPDSCSLPDLSYRDTDEYLQNYYSTDHHWRIQGAVKGCDEVLKALGKGSIVVDEYVMAYEGPFYGSAVRYGLSPVASDSVYDIKYDIGNLTATVNGENESLSAINDSLADDYTGFSKRFKYQNVYADYFHTDWEVLDYENSDAPDGRLLIIGDSYTNCIDRVFAQAYRNVRVIDPRHYEGDLGECIESFCPDDIVVLMGVNNIIADVTVEKLK